MDVRSAAVECAGRDCRPQEIGPRDDVAKSVRSLLADPTDVRQPAIAATARLAIARRYPP